MLCFIAVVISRPNSQLACPVPTAEPKACLLAYCYQQGRFGQYMKWHCDSGWLDWGTRSLQATGPGKITTPTEHSKVPSERSGPICRTRTASSSSRVDDLPRLVEAGRAAVAVELRPQHALHVQLHELRRAAAHRVHVGARLEETPSQDGAPARRVAFRFPQKGILTLPWCGMNDGM